MNTDLEFAFVGNISSVRYKEDTHTPIPEGHLYAKYMLELLMVIYNKY